MTSRELLLLQSHRTTRLVRLVVDAIQAQCGILISSSYQS